jgi:hypothetical protein
MTEEIDISSVYVYTLNSKNINQWLKKSILVSVYVYTKYRFNLKNFKNMEHESGTENTVPKLLDQAELLMQDFVEFKNS